MEGSDCEPINEDVAFLKSAFSDYSEGVVDYIELGNELLEAVDRIVCFLECEMGIGKEE